MTSQVIELIKVKMEALLEIPYGKEQFQLGFDIPGEGDSIPLILDLLITENSYIFIDYWNFRTVEFAKDFEEF